VTTILALCRSQAGAFCTCFASLHRITYQCLVHPHHRPSVYVVSPDTRSNQQGIPLPVVYIPSRPIRSSADQCIGRLHGCTASIATEAQTSFWVLSHAAGLHSSGEMTWSCMKGTAARSHVVLVTPVCKCARVHTALGGGGGQKHF